MILENSFTKWYFEGEDHLERHLQMPLFFTFEGTDCKALLDGLVINHDSKKIIPFDLKTTSKGVFNFYDSYIHYGYYRQAAFYTTAVKEYLAVRSNYDDKISDYSLEPFRFIVADSKQGSKSPALIYVTTPNDIKVGLYGGEVKGGGYKKRIKGIHQLIDDYK